MAGLAQPLARVLALGLILQNFSLASRVFLGWGNLPAVTYARVLLSNFLLAVSSQAVQDRLPCFPAVGEVHPFPWAATPAE